MLTLVVSVGSVGNIEVGALICVCGVVLVVLMLWIGEATDVGDEGGINLGDDFSEWWC